MKKKSKLTALSLALVLLLTACMGKSGVMTKQDAEIYVDGLIKENYLGQYEEGYLELVEITEAEAEAVYENGLETEVSFFVYLYDIQDPSEELQEELKELYREIYSHTRYEVVSAALQDDGSFSVKVNVEPIDIVQLVSADWDKNMKDFYEEYPSDKLNAMNDKEYEKYEQAWARQVVDLYLEKMPEIGNMTVRSLVVQIERDEGGHYSITDESFQQLNDLIIDYTDTAGTEV